MLILTLIQARVMDGDMPVHREVEMTGALTATAYLGGLHHGYARAA